MDGRDERRWVIRESAGVRSFFERSGDGPTEITHAQDPRRAAAVGGRPVQAPDCRQLGIGPTAAGACLRRAREAGVGWPLPDDLDDAALERRLYPVPTTTAKDWRSLPDWPAIHRELRRKGVTLQLVWEEYRSRIPTVTAAAGSANSIGPGKAGCR